MNENEKKTQTNFKDKCNAVHREQLTAGGMCFTEDKRSQISNLRDMQACVWVYEN